MKPAAAELPRPERRAALRPAGDDAPWTRARRLRHHGFRLALLLGTAGAVTALFPAARGSDTPVLERGVVARKDVVAEIPFQIPKTTEELRHDQDEAASGIPPVYDFDPTAADSVVRGLRVFFASVDRQLAAAPPAGRDLAVRRALAAARVPTTLGAAEVLGDSSRRSMLAAATEATVRERFGQGIARGAAERNRLPAVRVRGLPDGERLVPSDSLHTADEFFSGAAAALPPELGADAAELQRLLLVRYFRPSLARNEAETRAARARARAAVDPVKARVLAGERIVGAREQVGEREEERLRAYQAALDAQRDERGGGRTTGRVLGSILYNLLLLGIVGFLLRLARLQVYDDDRAVSFLAVLIVAVSGMAALVARGGLPPELIPVPFATLVVAVLWGGRLALVTALVLALLLGGQTPFLGAAIAFSAAVGGASASFGVRLAQRRLQTWAVAGVVGAAYAGCALAVGLQRAEPWQVIGWSALWGVVNATACTLLAIGFLPVAEWFTRVTTAQTLLELADPNHPLLRRLSMEAPGTYAHTISVANLAEAVCNAIGANALLARVGVYYHDVGKIAKPHYFIENQPRGRNPHDKLKPSMSAAIVRSHVVEGVRLAEEYKVPATVRAFITQHHGTQSISFFLDQARAADPDARVNATDFQYLGPKPQTRETAVVMMADSVESAARVLQDPTPERIRELVDRIVGAKIAAGQLDECPLTLREIHTTREVLARVLSGMYHQRLDYPSAVPAPELPREAQEPEPTRAAG
ncbi:MAG TPA: HDIG domain-containing protein [Longimicrobium sp.]